MRMATMAAVAAAALVLALLGCAQPSKFEKAGVAEEARKADARACYKSEPVSSGESCARHAELWHEAGIAQGIVDADRIGGYRRRLYDECMIKRGYKEVKPS
jgi:hypothetical protein